MNRIAKLLPALFGVAVVSGCASSVAPQSQDAYVGDDANVAADVTPADAPFSCPAPGTLTTGDRCDAPPGTVCASGPANTCGTTIVGYVRCSCEGGNWTCAQRDPPLCPVDAGTCGDYPVQAGAPCTGTLSCPGSSPCLPELGECTCRNGAWDCGTCDVDASDAADAADASDVVDPCVGASPGEPCAVEWAQCSYPADVCGAPGTLSITCMNGLWVGYPIDCFDAGGGNAGDANDACAAGQACPTSGATCWGTYDVCGHPTTVMFTCRGFWEPPPIDCVDAG